MLDGHVLVDAHVHVPRLDSLAPAWIDWARQFGRPGILEEIWTADGTPDPAALDRLMGDEGVDVALLFCEYSPKATGYQLFDDLLPLVEHNPRRNFPFVQEFDFRPTSVRDFGVEEVEVSFRPVGRGVEVALTVDRRGGFFKMGGERTARFQVSERDLPRLNMAAELRQAINSLR